jgi:hypothetical protein
VLFDWIIHDTRLSIVEIGDFGDRLLQREVPGEGTCLHVLVPVTAFSRRRFLLVSVWVFCLFSCSQFCLYNAQLLLGYLLA